MKTRAVALWPIVVCALAAACSQTAQPAPTVVSSVTATSSSEAPSSATPPSPTSPTPTSQVGDGSTGNALSAEYCARNEDPGCPAGSYVGPNAILSPNGDGSYVPCEGTICTNPNHGAGTNPAENGGVKPPGSGSSTQAP